MNAKKAGLITAGVLAAAVAAAPAAWAFGEQAPENCSYTANGADKSETSEISENNPFNPVVQAPQAGGQEFTFGECSTYGQNNNEGNGEGNTFNGEPVEFPAAPGLPGVPSFPGVPQ